MSDPPGRNFEGNGSLEGYYSQAKINDFFLVVAKIALDAP